MTPTPEQIKQALQNMRRPGRPPAGCYQRVKKKGRIMGPALSDIAQTDNERRYQRRQTGDETCPRNRL